MSLVSRKKNKEKGSNGDLGIWLVFTKEQLLQIEEKDISSYIDLVIFELTKSKTIVPGNDEIRRLINELKGAGILNQIDILRFIRLGTKFDVLFDRLKPDWLKNILYCTSDSKSKLDAIEGFLVKD